MYVHESVHDRFLERLTEQVDRLVLGDPSREDTQVSALITPGDTERVESWVREATDEGAELVRGGDRVDGRVIDPVVLDGITPTMKVSSTEVFGPVVGVASYRRFDDAVDAANDTRYGLQASVFTADVATALDAARRLDFGGVLVNEVPTWRTDQQPYGGVRDSGNTREGPAYAVEELTERRMVAIQG